MFKIRQDQVELLQRPSYLLRRRANSFLQAWGVDSDIDEATSDLVLCQPDVGTSRFQFADDGRVLSMRGFDGRVQRFESVARHRCALVDQGGQRTQYEFNDRLQVVATIGPTGFREEFDYRGGLLLERRLPDGRAITLEYDDGDKLRKVFDGRRNALRLDYHENGGLQRLRDRTGAVTEFVFDSESRPLQFTTPTNATWNFEYDAERARNSLIFPDGSREQLQFQDDRVTEIIRRNGKPTKLSYNEAGKVVAVDYPDGGRLEFAYNEKGSFTKVSNGSHVVEYEYDDKQRRVAETVDGVRVEVHYDADGLLRELITHRGETLGFDYGLDQRINCVTDWLGRRYHVRSDAAGMLTGLEFPNGMRWSRSLNPQGVPLTDVLEIQQKQIRRLYEYDQNDIVCGVTDSTFGTKRHRFDAEDQLTAVASPLYSKEYAYDGHGNSTQIGNQSLRYNNLDQIDSPGLCRYDELGRMVEWRDGTGHKRFHYNAQGFLVRVEFGDGRFAEYEYDGMGRRLVKRAGGITTRYTWWGDTLLAEDVDGAITSQVDYLYLPNTYISLAQRRDGKTYFYQIDHLDTPIRLFDESNQLVWHAEPHGFEFVVLVRKVPQPLRFPGQYWDEETGLHYNGARYFAPSLGRFVSPDPLGFADSTNLYQYAKSNPVAFTDPTGLILPVIGALALGAAGGAIIGGAFAVVQNGCHNFIEGKPVTEGWQDAVKSGAKNGAIGGLGAAAGVMVAGPVGLVAGAILAPALYAAGEAIWDGKNAVECCKAFTGALPFLGSYQRYKQNLRDPSVKHAEAQLILDLCFDLLSLGLMGKGARGLKAKTGGWTEPLRLPRRSSADPNKPPVDPNKPPEPKLPGQPPEEPPKPPVPPDEPPKPPPPPDEPPKPPPPPDEPPKPPPPPDEPPKPPAPKKATVKELAETIRKGREPSATEQQRRAGKSAKRELTKRSKQGEKDATIEKNKLDIEDALRKGRPDQAGGPDMENQVIDSQGDSVVEAGAEKKVTMPDGSKVPVDVDCETTHEVMEIKNTPDLQSNPEQVPRMMEYAKQQGKKPVMVVNEGKVSPADAAALEEKFPGLEVRRVPYKPSFE